MIRTECALAPLAAGCAGDKLERATTVAEPDGQAVAVNEVSGIEQISLRLRAQCSNYRRGAAEFPTVGRRRPARASGLGRHLPHKPTGSNLAHLLRLRGSRASEPIGSLIAAVVPCVSPIRAVHIVI